jgi:hypothetical protein
MVANAHGGIKPQRFSWIKDSGKIVSVGTNDFNEREYAVIDTRGDISKPLVKSKLDNNTTPIGQMHFDADNEIMYV